LGDIINVGIKADLTQNNDVTANIFGLLAQYYNAQLIGISPPGNRQASAKMPAISPELIQYFAKALSEQK
jgi:hypothetical protein